jgi:hypothetical protein
MRFTPPASATSLVRARRLSQARWSETREDEHAVSTTDLLDAGVVFGAGFAPFTGGPIRYAKERGVANVVARLRDFAERFGTRFTPHEGWQTLRGAA